MVIPKSLKKKRRVEDANEVFIRLHKIAKAGEDGSDLPEEIYLYGFSVEEIWSTWTAWRAGGGKFLPFPGALLDQPEGLMGVLWLLDSLLSKVTEQFLEKKRKNEPVNK